MGLLQSTWEPAMERHSRNRQWGTLTPSEGLDYQFTTMIRMDPASGRFSVAGVEETLEPRMRYHRFESHPAFPLMPEVPSRRASNYREHRFPEGTFEGYPVTGTASFTNGELESLWLAILTGRRDGALNRYLREEPRLLELQDRWLRDVVGVESREYPWGLVWSRFNINAGWHDIAIFFS